MDEIVVDDAEIVAVIHGVDQLLAHAHQRRGAAGREIEPAEQFEPARLAGVMQLGRGFVGRRLLPVFDRRLDAGAIGAEGGGQRLEEGDPRPDRQILVAAEDVAGQRHAGGLAAAGQQRLAQLEQAGRALMRRLAALNQGAAAVGDALQHFAEKGGIHRILPIRPAATS